MDDKEYLITIIEQLEDIRKNQLEIIKSLSSKSIPRPSKRIERVDRILRGNQILKAIPFG